MDRDAHFSMMLRQYMDVAGYSGTARLANRVNDVFESPGFLHRGTIANWLNGHIKYVRNWQKLVAVGVVLNLDIAEMNMLLVSAALPTIWELWETHGATEQGFFKHVPETLLSNWAIDDELPSPGLLPANSRMPLRPNPLFVGREESLQTIARSLQQSDSNMPSKTVVLTGIGGIGKTQLAAEFAHRYGRYFTGGVFWLHFDQPETILNQVALCGQMNNPELEPNSNLQVLPLHQQARLVQRDWQENVPRLLIFDGCEEEMLLSKWSPITGGCRILVTSRRAQWDMSLGLTTINLNTLEQTESIQLLHNFLPEEGPDTLTALAAELGDLPLALHLAGNYLMKYKHAISIPEYIKQLSSIPTLTHLSMQGEASDISPTNHVSNVQKTFALSYQKLDPNLSIDQVALIIVARVAFFAPGEPIPRDLLQMASGYADQPTSDLSFDAGLIRLDELGLIRLQAEGGIWVHQLITEFLQAIIVDSTAQSDVEETLKAEARRCSRETQSPTLLRAWYPHLRYVTDVALPREDIQAAGLANELGIYLYLDGEYTQAKVCLERTLAIRERLLGPDHAETSECLNHLGVLLNETGDYVSAQLCLVRSLDIDERVLGPEHSRTTMTLNNLGNLLIKMGEYEKAKSYLERALEIQMKIHGTEHMQTAMYLNNLGNLSRAMGEYEKAYSYYEQALTIGKQVLGSTHPGLAYALNNLGYVQQIMKNYEQAKQYLDQALSLREQTLGIEHPITAQSLMCLGDLYQVTGDTETARTYYERALTIQEKSLGFNHPDIAYVYNNLGELFQAEGSFEKAKLHYEKH